MDDDKRISENNIQVGFGENRLMTGGSQRSNIFRIIVHENFDRSTLENDIALLMLQTQVVYSPSVLPICLPELGIAHETTGTIVGFGGTENDQYGSSSLRHADIPIATKDECYQADADFFGQFLNQGNFCAGKKGELKNVCGGDSGEMLKLFLKTFSI